MPEKGGAHVFEKILVPLDGSKLAEKALPYAEILAHKFNAELILLQVLYPVAFVTDFGETRFVSSDTLHEWEAKVKVYLTGIQIKLRELGLQASLEILEGNPVAEMILDLAGDRVVDLIVMSTHGYSGRKQWVYGSVASKVLEQAPCPVFLVRVKEGDDQRVISSR